MGWINKSTEKLSPTTAKYYTCMESRVDSKGLLFTLKTRILKKSCLRNSNAVHVMAVLDEHVAHSKSVELQELAEFKMFKLLFFSRNSSVFKFSNGMGKAIQV